MELKELYKEIILDHGKNPRNKGKCKDFNYDASGHNPLCGDKVHIFVKLSKDDKVEDLSFEGEGCAISLASASILTDIIKNKNIVIANKITEDFLKMIKNNSKITLNRMLTFESVKARLDREQPLTILEFNYMLLQAYDFVYLNKNYNCILQMGGSDQWGNILSGVDLIRKINKKI